MTHPTLTTLSTVSAAIAATAATLGLALAPALSAAPSTPLDGLHVVELPRVVISASRDVRHVELPRVVVQGTRRAEPVALAGSRSGAQPVMSRRGD